MSNELSTQDAIDITNHARAAANAAIEGVGLNLTAVQVVVVMDYLRRLGYVQNNPRTATVVALAVEILMRQHAMAT